jgi:hypothetical protein
MHISWYLQFSRFTVHRSEESPPWSYAHLHLRVSIHSEHAKVHRNAAATVTSGISIRQGYLVPASNSVLLASFRPRTDRANSMMATCIPRHMPRYGTLFSLAYLAARILPPTPPWPQPPGTRTPSAPWENWLVCLTHRYSEIWTYSALWLWYLACSFMSVTFSSPHAFSWSSGDCDSTFREA